MKTKDRDIIEKMESRRSAMTTERSSFISHWQEIEQYISPRTSRFLRENKNEGGKYTEKIINAAATEALKKLESGLMAGMSSPARPWFMLSPPDPGMKEFGPVKEWLDTVSRMMREVFARSNLYSVLPKTYGSLGAYGTAAFGVVEDEKEVVRFYPFPVGSFMIDCNERMGVDALYREYSQTVRQLVERFGLENVSDSVRAQWDRGNYGSWVSVVHGIEPNWKREEGKLDSRDKPYLSVYYEEGKKTPLLVSGFDEFPAVVSRWHVNGEDAYGTRCPGMDSLGTIKALQLEEKRKYQAIDYHVRPPQMADAMIRNSGADLLPGGVTWVAGVSQSPGGAIRPVYQTNHDAVTVLSNDIDGVVRRINQSFMMDVMFMLTSSDNPQMTAREIEERHQEKLLVLGPLLEQQNDDLFDPLIDRTFNLMFRRGLLPPPPEELQGQALRVEYTSIMAQAQKLVGVASIERLVGFVGNLASVRPDVLDKIDFDQMLDEYGEMTGVPSKIIISDDQVAAIRESRAQAQQAQQMAAMVQPMEQGARAAKTLSETDMQGENALTRLLTGGAVAQ